MGEKNEKVLLKVLYLLKNMLYGEAGTPQALKTNVISRLTSLLDHKIDEVLKNLHY